MRKAIIIILAVLLSSSFADFGVYGYSRAKGHIKKNGTYIKPYHRTKSDSSKINNFSTKGNINPYTGKKGNKHPYHLKNKIKRNRG